MYVFKRSNTNKLIAATALTCALASFQSVNAQDVDDNTATAINEPRYVSDVLLVPLRSGNSNQHRIVHKGLKSGTSITLLEEANGWSRVRTNRNLEGWIPTRYLLKKPTANLQLIRANKKIEQLTSKAGPLGEKLLTAEAKIQALEKNIQQLERDNNRQGKEFDRIKGLSGDQIRLDRENKALYQSNEELRNELDTLKAENTSLSTKLLSNDIMYGAFAVLLGLVATLVTQHLTRSRKRSEWG